MFRNHEALSNSSDVPPAAQERALSDQAILRSIQDMFRDGPDRDIVDINIGQRREERELRVGEYAEFAATYEQRQ